MTLNLIFVIGVIVFAASSGYFWFTNSQKAFNSAFLVTTITTVSYLVMLEGGLAVQLSDGAVIHWSRWVGYAFSCPLLFYVVTSGIDSVQRRVTLSGVMSLVMISGALSAVWTGWFFWIGFGFSTFLFVITLIALFEHSDDRTLGSIQKYVWFGWVVFPIVFMLGPSGLYLLSAGVAAIAYLLLDVFTKIAFYAEMKDRSQAKGWLDRTKNLVG